MDETANSPDGDGENIDVRPADLNGSLFGRLELVWPGKDVVGSVRQDSDGAWELLTGRPDNEAYPLVEISNEPEPNAVPSSLLIVGDRLAALRTLRRSIGQSVRLAYVDAPRIGIDNAAAAFRGDTPMIYSAWLSVLRTHLAAVEPLLARDGVVVIHVGEAEAAAARLLADELFRGQHIGTVVWQRSYAPRNMKGMRDFTATHDCLICYAKQKDALPAVGLRRPPEGYDNPDGDPRGPWKAEHKGAASRRENSDFDTYVPPYRWRIVRGRLPTGLWRLSPMTGVIWGNEISETGDFPLTIEATDSHSRTVTKDMVLSVREGDAPNPPDIPWLFEEIRTSGDFRIETETLPVGAIGKPYYAICLASGGSPYQADPKRPGSGRYWEFARDTLTRAYQEDAVYLGRDKPTAIPHPKSYSPPEGELVVENQQTWWPGRVPKGAKSTAFAGYTEDATKHLKALRAVGAIENDSAVSKPEMLLARLVDIFTLPGDLTLEVFCQAADLAAVAMKRGRSFVALAGSTDRDRDFAARCAAPRLRAVLAGRDRDLENEAKEIALRADGYIPYGGGGSFATARLGNWIVRRGAREEFAELNAEDYADFEAIANAVLTAQGFMPVPGEVGLGHAFTHAGGAGIVLPPDEYMTPEIASALLERLGVGGRATLFYFRASPDFDTTALPADVAARRVPFDLGI